MRFAPFSMGDLMAFKNGDLVRLKSGGPVMTVNVAHTDGSVNTVWFSGKKMESGYFQSGTLMTAQTDEHED